MRRPFLHLPKGGVHIGWVPHNMSAAWARAFDPPEGNDTCLTLKPFQLSGVAAR